MFACRQRDPHLPAAVATFKDILDVLPKIRGNPRAPHHKGTYSEHFSAREQNNSLGS